MQTEKFQPSFVIKDSQHPEAEQLKVIHFSVIHSIPQFETFKSNANYIGPCHFRNGSGYD
jgi:hypothetical protein